MSLAAGTRLGPYEILAPLGAGGMGEVWRARDTRLDRDVALKVLPEALATDPERLARFEREARTVAALNHPNIVTVHSVDEIDGVRFLTMEVVEGATLAKFIPERGLSVETLLEVAIPLADALAAAHARGVIHRDLKPGNVMVTTERRVKVLDFGLAKLAAASAPGTDPDLTGTAGLTVAGQVFGTLAYMSPEQAQGRVVDPRSDLFSLGTVLYEMATGARPFTGDSQAAIISAILRDTPSAVSDVNRTLPIGLSRIIQRCLQKEPERRYSSANEVRTALVALQESLLPARGAGFSRKARIAVAVAVVVAAGVAGWEWWRATRERSALEKLPEIAVLVDQAKFDEAAAMIREARTVLPRDPTLEKYWLKATFELSIETVPPGADVSIRPYKGDPDIWESLGKTPLVKIRLPKVPYVFRYAKPGFVSRQEIGGPDGPELLDAVGSIPAGMTRVPVYEGKIPAELSDLYDPSGVQEFPVVPGADFHIDETEVTNEAYKRFVDAGGYRRPELWKQPFVKEGRTIPWQEAIASFRDSTGRPGPATWEVGSFPKGLEKHPVAGVSWFEAAAYAEFVGKSLPTVYHWAFAAGMGWSPLIVPGSNFGGTGTVPVGGPTTLTTFGAYDMAGNVKEWCWNERGPDKRYILGGGFGEPSYRFGQTDAQSPWARMPTYGFRCAHLSSPPGEAATRIDPAFRDDRKREPVSDELFGVYKGLYSYDRGELDAQVEETEQSADWRREKISFAAAYAGERMAANLFLPLNATPPFQTVVYFPGGDAQYTDRIEDFGTDLLDFVPKSGRALVIPVYKSSFERQDDYKPGATAVSFRDHMILWSKDLSRTLDYLGTRPEIDSAKLGFVGFSWGAGLAPVLLSVEGRFQAAILRSGGFWRRLFLPEADPFNFAPHVRLPVLMLNDRYDSVFPVEGSQLPFFRRLGTAEKDKRYVVFETTHGSMRWRGEALRESLDWLDKYLGPVKP